ncbi:hypothetical protein [Pontibacter rugosus]|uniref:DUF4279 domain-containing protein n=1 Tax=Pontibacter rugosus TaxID=1745966 RepID=A0ABW3SMH7_9BACT
MKYCNLYIDFAPSWVTYDKLTNILGQTPNKHEKTKFETSDEPSTWWLQLVEDEGDSNADSINFFLDILEPNFDKLEMLDIKRENILIWLVYEYQYQCALSFIPNELERLGRNGITLNIDCHETKEI